MLNNLGFKKKLLPFYVGLLSLFLWSCRDQDRLNTARAFASMANNFSNNTSEISNDIYFSCIRRAGMFPIDLSNSRANRESALQSCETLNRPASELAKDSASIVVDYMVVIGQVADIYINTSEELNRIKTALTSQQTAIFQLDSNTLDAGFEIINFLLDLAIRRAQIANLELAIICGDDSIQAYSTGLADAFQLGYVDGVLTDEQMRLEDYYSARATIMQISEAEQLDFHVLEERLADATETIVGRKKAGESYVNLIRKTAKAHSDLKEIFAGGENITDEQCSNYFAEQMETVHGITLDEALEISRVADEYHKDVEKLLESIKENWPD